MKERRGKRNGGGTKKKKEGELKSGRMKFEWKFRPGGKEKTGLSTFKFIFARVSYLSLFPLTLS